MCHVSGSRTMGVNQQGAADLNMTSLHGYKNTHHITHVLFFFTLQYDKSFCRIIDYLPFKIFANRVK